MKWIHAISDFKDYLKIERGLSENSISSYENDLKKLKLFLNKNSKEITPLDVKADHIKEFVYFICFVVFLSISREHGSFRDG